MLGVPLEHRTGHALTGPAFSRRIEELSRAKVRAVDLIRGVPALVR
jgi:hypothetical protein